MWDRMLVYFGIVEDDDASWDERARERTARRQGGSTTATRETSRPQRQATPAATAVHTGPAGVGVVPPRTFNDAQKVADSLKQGLPVIVNLQQTDSDLSKRLIDFASGLTYGLDGSMQRIADKVFLLTPANVSVSAEERAALAESGFFNQS